MMRKTLFKIAALLLSFGLLFSCEEDGAKLTVTDDASAMETAGLPVKLCEWTEPNIKITYPADLALAAAILQLAPR